MSEQITTATFAAHVVGSLTLQEAAALVERLYGKSTNCPGGSDPTCLETINLLDQAYADWFGTGLLFSIGNDKISSAVAIHLKS